MTFQRIISEKSASGVYNRNGVLLRKSVLLSDLSDIDIILFLVIDVS